jgi:hypothetical protein
MAEREKARRGAVSGFRERIERIGGNGDRGKGEGVEGAECKGMNL